MQNYTKSGSPGKFKCQLANYEINYTSHSAIMVEQDFVDRELLGKDIAMHEKFVVKATVLVPDQFKGFYNMQIIYFCR